MHRQVDRATAGRLADADPVMLLSCAVAWAIQESRRDSHEDPIPRWLGLHPERVARWNAVQLGVYLKHAAASGTGSNSKHRRSVSRVTGMLMQWRGASTRLLPIVSRLAQLVEPRVREQLAFLEAAIEFRNAVVEMYVRAGAVSVRERLIGVEHAVAPGIDINDY